MQYYKLLLFFYLGLFSGVGFQSPRPYSTRWVINKECFLSVEGSTNINKFNCAITNYCKPDTITFYRNSNTSPVKISGSLKLDVQNFDCHNPIMTKDLRKTLKAKEFPKLTIRFINFNKYPQFNVQEEVIKGLVTIELAGITQHYEVNYRFVRTGATTITLIGTRQVNFSDFHIVPPRKLGGMIKTNEKLNVEFSLKVKVLD